MKQTSRTRTFNYSSNWISGLSLVEMMIALTIGGAFILAGSGALQQLASSSTSDAIYELNLKAEELAVQLSKSPTPGSSCFFLDDASQLLTYRAGDQSATITKIVRGGTLTGTTVSGGINFYQGGAISGVGQGFRSFTLVASPLPSPTAAASNIPLYVTLTGTKTVGNSLSQTAQVSKQFTTLIELSAPSAGTNQYTILSCGRK